jgi:hypothetical protein
MNIRAKAKNTKEFAFCLHFSRPARIDLLVAAQMVIEILWDVAVCRLLNGLRVFEHRLLGRRAGLMGKRGGGNSRMG